MLNIVLFGPPGAGKGTQAEFLIKNFGLIHISTGDLLRNEIAQKTELGIKAKVLMDKGDLVPDEVVEEMIKNQLTAHSDAKGFIFDGFPRTAAQAKVLDELLKGINSAVTAMVALEVEKQELISRILNRGKSSGRADDQNEKTIENRIAVYNKKTAPLKDYYDAQKKYYGIYGMGTIKEISGRINDTLKKLV